MLSVLADHILSVCGRRASRGVRFLCAWSCSFSRDKQIETDLASSEIARDELACRSWFNSLASVCTLGLVDRRLQNGGEQKLEGGMGGHVVSVSRHTGTLFTGDAPPRRHAFTRRALASKSGKFCAGDRAPEQAPEPTHSRELPARAQSPHGPDGKLLPVGSECRAGSQRRHFNYCGRAASTRRND